MTTSREDFEALMPEPVGYRTRYRSEPDMIGHYPWSYADATRRRRKYDRPEHEYEDLYTADQMRAMYEAATERAAKVVEQVGPKEGSQKIVTAAFAAAIRGQGKEG